MTRYRRPPPYDPNQPDLFGAAPVTPIRPSLPYVQRNPGEPLTPLVKERRAEQLSASISLLEPPTPADTTYLHSIFSHVALPRSKVKAHEFHRSCGTAQIVVQSGYLADADGHLVRQPVPYGPLPRLFLMYLTRTAKRLKSPEIPLGDSVAQFMQQLGSRYCTGGARGSLTAFRTQAMAFSAAKLTLSLPPAGPHGARTLMTQPIREFEAWRPNAQGDMVWPRRLVLSTDFYDEIQAHSVPLDDRAIAILQQSPFALDVYVWLAARLRQLTRPTDLKWAALLHQFGAEYKQSDNLLRSFRKDFLTVLTRVIAVYRAAKVEKIDGGIRLHQSPPPVPEEGGRVYSLPAKASA